MPTVTLVLPRTEDVRNRVVNGHACRPWPLDVRHPVVGHHGRARRGHLVEATRALGEQLKLWGHPPLASVLLTHAHFGHVDGLGLFGRETLN